MSKIKDLLSPAIFIVKVFFFFIVLLPLGCLAQFTISGRILNQADTKPVANVDVFLNNATIGDQTADDGTFTLHNIKPGKYDLVISIVGFETYNQSVTVGNSNTVLPDITIFPKTIALKEVSIKFHADPNREKYYDWFKDEFLGTSAIAKECKILNPQMLDLNYDYETGTLTASSSVFLEIENEALGYKIKYLLTDFTLSNKDNSSKKIYYKGAVLYKEMKGTPSQETRWQKNRQEIYEGSSMHFFRSAFKNQTTAEGFRILQLSTYANPDRPSDSLIEAKIKFYKELKSRTNKQKDSLSYWEKKFKLPTNLQKLMPYPLHDKDIVKQADKPGLFELGCDNDALYITYNKSRHFHKNDMLNYLDAANNTENTLISFNSPVAYFYSNGVIINPYSVLFSGVWARHRVAELLPLDYEPPRETTVAPVDI